MGRCHPSKGKHMTQEDIIRMAREADPKANLSEPYCLDHETRAWLERFAALVAAAEFAKREWNFCERCGKRTADPTTIHTCTPPDDNALQRGLARTKEVVAGSQAFYGFPHGPVSTPNAGGKCVTAGETAPFRTVKQKVESQLDQ